jgi:hypothetical protein
MKTLRIYFLSLIALSICVPVKAQEGLNKEVNVIKAYKPTISDAYKLKFMPEMDDTVKVPTQFNYFIQPVMEPVDFRVRSLDAMTLRKESSPELKTSYVRAGFGSYWTPYGELDINTLRNRNGGIGINMAHLSSQGRITMPDDRSVDAGYADNQVKLYGSTIMDQSTFSGNIHFNEDHHFLYGYNTDTLSDGSLVTPMNLRVLTKDSMDFQRFIVVGADFEWKADERSRKGFLYKVDGGYDFLMDFQQEMEHTGNLDFDFSQKFKSWSFGGDIGADYIYRVISTGSDQYALAHADPWVGFEWKYITLKAGPKVAMDRNASEFFFYPMVNMEVNITNLVVPYIGLDGYYEDNNYLKIKKENPFIGDDLDILPTNHMFVAYGGLRGRFLPKMAFNLYVSWEDVDNWHFYRPDASSPLMNRFVVDYDSGSLLSAGGEIGIRQPKNLSVILKGNYYKYDLDSLPAAWHKPEWDATLTTRYGFKENLELQADVYLMGTRFVPASDPLANGPVQKLDGIIDINISAKYAFRQGIGFFGRINNLISDDYYIWQNYPTQGINFLLGISWTF